jgi:hypothetical protein
MLQDHRDMTAEAEAESRESECEIYLLLHMHLPTNRIPSLRIPSSYTAYFAEYLTFRKSKGMYLTPLELLEKGGWYFIFNHVLDLSFHGDDEEDTEV